MKQLLHRHRCLQYSFALPAPRLRCWMAKQLLSFMLQVPTSLLDGGSYGCLPPSLPHPAFPTQGPALIHLLCAAFEFLALFAEPVQVQQGGTDLLRIWPMHACALTFFWLPAAGQ